MADYASIARPYAKALFTLARDANAYAEWADALTKLSAMSEHPEFANLVNDPKRDQAQVTNLLKEVLGDEPPANAGSFIQLIVDNDRTLAIAEIHRQFSALVAQAQASIDAQVQSAMALSDAQKNAIREALEKRLGLKVNLEETVDADLVGGAIIRAGDLVIDGSAKGRIEKLTSALMR